jgi:CHAD domain-containing protein
MSITEAFQVIAFACLRHFRSNEPRVAAARDVDALHQSRVALRRLRSAFSLFKPILARPAAERFREELRALSNTLGEARNLDVLLRRRSEALAPDARQRLVEERTRAYDRVIEELRSPQVRTMMLDLVEWVALAAFIGHGEGGRSDAEAPLRPFADHVLRRFWKKLKRGGSDLPDLDDGARHELRISAKKLRYAAEFFAALYDKRAERRDEFVARLQELQEDLGELNDVVTERALEEHLAALGIDLPRHATPGGEAKHKAALIAKSDVVYRELAAIGPFWG